MKKFLSLATIAVLFFCAACTNEKAGVISAQAQKNLDANHAISKMFETGDFSKLGDYIAADGVEHAGMNGDIKGLANIKDTLERYSKMASNMKNEIVKELADDDYVMSWMKESGTMKEDGMGMKAGDKYSWNIIEVSKYKDGKATDHWSFISMGDMMESMNKMMQSMPASSPTSTDKAK